MKRYPGQIFRVIGAIFFIASPIITHFILTHSNSNSTSFGVAGSALLLCQGLLISVLIGRGLRSPFRLPAIAAVMACSVSLCVFHLRGGLMLSSGSPHALIYSGLLIGFGLSLFPGHEPIVTYFARAIHGNIAPEIENYTRRITWAWCWFFVAQLTGSLLLLLFAPRSVLSLFVNLCNLPLVGAMLCTEYIYRQWRHPAHPPERLADMFRSFRPLRTVPLSGDRHGGS